MKTYAGIDLHSSRIGWVEERNPTSIARNCKMIERTISVQQPYLVGFRKLNPTYELKVEG